VPRRAWFASSSARSPCCLTPRAALWSAPVEPSRGESPDAAGAATPRTARGALARAVPWLVTALIFGLIFSRVPFAAVWRALAGARLAPYLAIMMPYSACYLAIDTFCLTRVINWFNCRIAYRDVLPIRASTYLLTLVNSNLGQGGIALYLHRRDGVPLLEVASSVLFLMFVEVYQLALFSSLGVLLARRTVDLPLGAVYVALYGYLALHLVFFRVADRWLARRAWARILRSFRLARPRHYLLLLLYKSPNFVIATVVYYFALQCFGMRLPYLELVLYLPIIFFSAALPIGVAHLGAPQLLWIYFFGAYAPEASLLAFSLATHFIFMIMNAALGLLFLPRATRELVRGVEPARARG
jgi:hypothetical protein